MANLYGKKRMMRAIDQTIDLLKKGWIKHSSAQSARGIDVDPHSKAAVCWCLSGALHRACNTNRDRTWWDHPREDMKNLIVNNLHDVIIKRTNHRFTSHIEFNDAKTTKLPSVIAVLVATKKAIDKRYSA